MQVEKTAWGEKSSCFSSQSLWGAFVWSWLKPWIPTSQESPKTLKWQSWILVTPTSEWHWAASAAVVAGARDPCSCLSGGTCTLQFPSKTSLGVLCHALVVPFTPWSDANSASFLCQGISIHFHRYHKPSFSDSFSLEPKVLTLPPALASPSVTWGGTVIKNALETGRCSQASRMQEKAGTSYFGQLGKETLKNSLGLSVCLQNSKRMCYTIHPPLIFHFHHHHKEVID